MGFFINGKAVDDEHSNQSGTLKNIRFLTKDDDLEDLARDKLGMIKSNEIIYLDSSERGN